MRLWQLNLISGLNMVAKPVSIAVKFHWYILKFICKVLFKSSKLLLVFYIFLIKEMFLG
jgi:hypothetical protein